MKIVSVSTALLFAICFMMLNACGADGEGGAQTPAQGEQPVLRGQITFQPEKRMFYGGLGDACDVTAQYSYVRAGAQVVVKDAAGTILATGALEPGIIVEAYLGSPHACRFVFAVQGVPTSTFYWIEVADSGSRAVGLPYDALKSQNWTVDLGVVE